MCGTNEVYYNQKNPKLLICSGKLTLFLGQWAFINSISPSTFSSAAACLC